PAVTRRAHPDRRRGSPDLPGQPHARRHSPHHLAHRSGRDGRRCDHHPGPVHLPVSGRGLRRKIARRLQFQWHSPVVPAARRVLRARPRPDRGYRMTAMVDPTTVAALAIGIMTGAGFLLVAAGAGGTEARRYTRRLDKIKARRFEKSVAEDTDVRSL